MPYGSGATLTTSGAKDTELRKVVRPPPRGNRGDGAVFGYEAAARPTAKIWERLLDWLYEDLCSGPPQVYPHRDGDYSEDKYAERFPKFEADRQW